MTLEEKVISIIRKNLETPVSKKDITGDSNLQNDLGADSFAILMIINGIEDECKITIKEEDITGIKTVSDIVKTLKLKFPDIEKKINESK